MAVSKSTMPTVRKEYRGIVADAIKRARELELDGMVFEFETVPEMTTNPEIGIELVKIMNEEIEEVYATTGFPATIRLTPNDNREFDSPPAMRTSSYLEPMLELFEEGARAGGDLLSIESTGGKELHDQALVECDVRGIVFALAVLGVRDMHYLWDKIVDIAGRTGRVAGGDTACGFANTAMVLAEKQYIPRVMAAIDRVLAVVRSLVAVDEGATGPDKDCGYEGVYLKAIAGIPISMEGKTAACAHSSPVGNISAAACDLWSNESVQNIKLLGGMAPTVSLEQLAYDARLMNAAVTEDSKSMLQRLMVNSDAHRDPQAFILAPENVIPIAQTIVSSRNPIDGAVSGALEALSRIENAVAGGSLRLPERETTWIELIRSQLSTIPREESSFIDEMLPVIDKGKVDLKGYGL
jgi:methanol--5-hydroxybenzimidazolylcobamide Co-methyltransferase